MVHLLSVDDLLSVGICCWTLLLNSGGVMQRASQEVKDAQMFREKMASVSEWMGRVKLPRELKTKIRAYYAEVGMQNHLKNHSLLTANCLQMLCSKHCMRVSKQHYIVYMVACGRAVQGACMQAYCPAELSA